MLDAQGIDDVVAYIATLPDERARPTLEGDADRGKSLYLTCGNCHGADGKGVWSTRAPRLAGMSDWYLARQLENFRRGNRGRHPQDFYGTQMAALSKMVHDEQTERDLVAYINTL
jgi:cytochrome c oxidase subunit 2